MIVGKKRRFFYYAHPIAANFVSKSMLMLLLFFTSCTEYTENGELVRHHFGYIKIVAPAFHAPESAVRALEVETYGVWAHMDSRSQGEDIVGRSLGAGYRFDRRELIPLDCRLVIRVRNPGDFKKMIEAFGEIRGAYASSGIPTDHSTRHFGDFLGLRKVRAQ